MSHGEHDDLLELARALGDGSEVDWDRLASGSRTEDERRLLDALIVLARMQRVSANRLTRLAGHIPDPADDQDDCQWIDEPTLLECEDRSEIHDPTSRSNPSPGPSGGRRIRRRLAGGRGRD
jgi:hypothetical protein